MVKNNFLKNTIINLKYFKNNCVVKYKIIQKRKLNGEKISLIEFFIEMGFLKRKEIKSDSRKSSRDKLNKKIKENEEKEKIINKKINKKSIYNTASVVGFIVTSFLMSFLLFQGSNNLGYLNITEENETKILNILKSPKTNTYIKNTYNEKQQDIEYFFLVVDNLDSYSYKIKLNDVSEDLRKELFQNNFKNTKSTDSLKNVNIETIIPFEDNYLINNKYNIEKTNLNFNTLDRIENNIKVESAINYKNFKNTTIASITILLSILLNLIYFSIKKVISKK